jgi:hypothetical protein
VVSGQWSAARSLFIGRRPDNRSSDKRAAPRSPSLLRSPAAPFPAPPNPPYASLSTNVSSDASGGQAKRTGV